MRGQRAAISSNALSVSRISAQRKRAGSAASPVPVP